MTPRDHGMAEQPVTLGEVYRICLRTFERVEAIDRRQQDLEQRVAVLEDREDRGARLGGIWGAIGGVLSGFVSGFLGQRTG
ncbi:MAG: hypothetical protein ACRD26_23570 [Vicinamibacterales bacterium]